MKFSDIDKSKKITFIMVLVCLPLYILMDHILYSMYGYDYNRVFYRNTLNLFMIFSSLQILLFANYKSINKVFPHRYLICGSIGMWAYWLFFTFL